MRRATRSRNREVLNGFKSGRFQLVDLVQNSRFGDVAPPPIENLPVAAQQHPRRLACDSEQIPGLEGGVPEHCERGTGGLNEILGQFQVVLSSDPDDGELVGVGSSELLDAGCFPAAGGSMGGPEPQHDGSIRGCVAGQVDSGTGGYVGDLDRGQFGFRDRCGWLGRLG